MDSSVLEPTGQLRGINCTVGGWYSWTKLLTKFNSESESISKKKKKVGWGGRVNFTLSCMSAAVMLIT